MAFEGHSVCHIYLFYVFLICMSHGCQANDSEEDHKHSFWEGATTSVSRGERLYASKPQEVLSSQKGFAEN